MFGKNVFPFIVMIGVVLTAFAQEQAEKVSIGIKEVIHSEILDEDINVYLFLPDGYSSSETKYPVFYMLYSVPQDFHF